MLRRVMPFFSSAQSGIDPDAQAYLTAAGITLGNVYTGDRITVPAGFDHPIDAYRIIDGVNRFVISLKTAGLWSKIKYMYPFLGYTVSEGAVNIISPGTKDLVPYSGFSAVMGRGGILFDGASWFSSGIFLSEFGDYSYTSGYYIVGKGGSNYGSQADPSDHVYGSQLGQDWYFGDFGQAFSYTSDQIRGLDTQNVLANNLGSIFAAGNKLQTITSIGSAAGNAGSNDIWVGQIHGIGGMGFSPCGTPCGIFFMSDGLDDADNVTINDIVERWAFDMGRNYDSIYNAFQFLGDSITVGIFASPTWHRFSRALCYYKNATELNWGTAGHTIVDCQNIDILNLVNKDAKHTRVFVAYGTNDVAADWNHAMPTMNLTIFTSTYTNVLNIILAAGYSVDDIVIISGYYCNFDFTQPGLDAYQDNYINAVESLAASFGITRCYNMKPLMIANGGTALLNGIHLNNDGNDFISGYLNTQLGSF